MLLTYIHICEAIRIKILHFESRNVENEGQNRNAIFIFGRKKILNIKFVTEILDLPCLFECPAHESGSATGTETPSQAERGAPRKSVNLPLSGALSAKPPAGGAHMVLS
jgi:hypothetical protein